MKAFRTKPFIYTLIFFMIVTSLLGTALGVTPAYATWSFTNRNMSDGLGSNDVNGVYVSGSNVYVATNNGLSISTDGGNTFINKTTADGLSSNAVSGVYVSGGTIYAATHGRLSISTDGGNSFIIKNELDGLGSHWLEAVFVNGTTVYVATLGGLSISTDAGNSFSNKTGANGLGDTILKGVFVEGNMVYAASTRSGVSISNDGGNSFINKTIANGLGNNWVFGVYAAGNTVYAATIDGLSISNDGGNTFSNKTTANGLGYNATHAVFATGNTIYAATQGGLSVSMDGGNTFSNMTTADGLASNRVHAVFVSNGVVYAGTYGGGLSMSADINTALPTATATKTATKTPTPAPTAALPAITKAFLSDAAQDGWVLESSENSNIGGSINNTATNLVLGDSGTKRQYLSILSFNTADIPDNAIITGVKLKIQQQSIIGGGSPVTVFQGFMVDIKTGFFGTFPALQALDFQATASKTLGPAIFSPVGEFYNFNMVNGISYINKLSTNNGLTQIRLRFKLDDNNNATTDYLGLYSSNAPLTSVSDRPQLIVTYHLP